MDVVRIFKYFLETLLVPQLCYASSRADVSMTICLWMSHLTPKISFYHTVIVIISLSTPPCRLLTLAQSGGRTKEAGAPLGIML